MAVGMDEDGRQIRELRLRSSRVIMAVKMTKDKLSTLARDFQPQLRGPRPDIADPEILRCFLMGVGMSESEQIRKLRLSLSGS